MRTLFAVAALAAAQPAIAGPILITGSQDPSYPETGFNTAPNDNRQLRVIGLYEAGSPGAGGPRPAIPYGADVVIDDQGSDDLYLVLSSYEPVNWKFSGAGLSSLKGVLFNGYYKTSYQGLGAGVAVTDRTGLGNYIVGTAYSYPNYNTTELLNFASSFYGDQVDSFIGKYTANAFLVSVNGTPSGIPEPQSWAMMILGFLGAGAAARRRATKLVSA